MSFAINLVEANVLPSNTILTIDDALKMKMDEDRPNEAPCERER
jgi:hypothetical protein